MVEGADAEWVRARVRGDDEGGERRETVAELFGAVSACDVVGRGGEFD